MARHKKISEQPTRPKRKATNAYIYRYLQTRNPSKLIENDLRKALEASLEECPDYWPTEDTASCSSSEQSHTTCSLGHDGPMTRRSLSNKRNSRLSSMQSVGNSNHNYSRTSQGSPTNSSANHNGALSNCPSSSVHKRYKPVARKNIYNEADFFHDGIMEYIEYELSIAMSKRLIKVEH